MTQVLAQNIRPHGIAPAQFTVLLLLWKRDGQSQSELLTEVKVEQATIALTLDRMERDGFIVKTPNPLDNRSRLICLTAKGRALEGPVLAIGREINERTLAHLSPAAQKQFVKQLQGAIANCRAALQQKTAD